jgi:hypothetical protein
MYSKLSIEYADPYNLGNTITIDYKLLENSVVSLWCERLISAQQLYNIDNPNRFYGFGSLLGQQQAAIELINYHIDVINNYKCLIHKNLLSITDQDTLNYLHNCFERYHGLLEQQSNNFFLNAPDIVKQSLRQLNISVHRCESVARGAYPRHVVTYFGLPKEKTLDYTHYQLFTDTYKFGTVYLNYVEIGKTLEDLSVDNDRYISDNAFQPFRFYSADFTVLFYNSNINHVQKHREKIKLYYNQNKEFFHQKGLDENHYYLRPGKIPLAEIDTELSNQQILQLVEHHQYVKTVKLQ